MTAHLRYLWILVSGTFWVLPLALAVAAGALAYFLTQLERFAISEWVSATGWLYTIDATGARQFLSTLVASSITVTSLVFSLTLVALSQVSSQLGPRLVRRFRRDRLNQFVLGALAGTFIFSLVLLRAVSSDRGDNYVPHLSITVALVLALISFGLLIYFIHHMASAIRVDAVVARVGTDLDAALFRFQASGRGAPDQTGPRDEPPARSGEPIRASKTGYIQTIDYAALAATAKEGGGTIRLDRRAGHFVLAGLPIGGFQASDGTADEIGTAIGRSIVIGAERTIAQDIEFAVGEMVEIALRALSTGVNDPRSAITCIDRLGGGLATVLDDGLPTGRIADADGRLRVVADVVTFEGLVRAAFDQIRQASAGMTAVMIRLVDICADLGRLAGDDAQRDALRGQVEAITRLSDSVADPADRDDLHDRIEHARRALGRE